MKTQHKALLSLGSNLGNKQENLQNALDLIHKKTGTVIQVSSIYESKSWGFDSFDFYNCVLLIHTFFQPKKLHKKLQKIEKKLGRQKTSDQYQARVIDIDIIDFDNEIIDHSNLTIPHKEMHNRLFVLQPLQEIMPNYSHPEKQIGILELLQQSPDKNSCHKIGKLTKPLASIDFSKYNYFAIEGNIGAGKTTLATKIAEDFNAKLVLERFAENPFLPKFYEDQQRFAFPLEMSFLADRYQQINDDLAQLDLFKDFVVADYHIFKSLIFAKVTLGEDEFRLYKTMFDIIYKDIPKPDLYIYLYQKTERLLHNIKKRGRSYEQEIPEDYLEKINNGYLDYIKTQKDLNVLVIDVTEMDFVKNQKDYLYILDAIRKKLDLI